MRYVTTFYRGAKAVGCFITQNAEEARERTQLWNSHGEGHTAITEERVTPMASGNEAIPSDQYLTQRAC